MIGIPISMRARGGCEICGGATLGWLVFCECRCGRKHGICFECLGTAQKIEMVKTTIIESEHDAEHGGKISMKFSESRFLRCPLKTEAKTAIAIGR